MSTEKYVSQTHRIHKTDEKVYTLFSDLRNLNAVIPLGFDNVDITSTTISFMIPKINKPATVELIEKEPFKMLKFTEQQNKMIPAMFWIQLKSIDENNTALRLTLHAEMNKITKMMVGKKLTKGIDQIAEQLAMFAEHKA